MTHSIKNVLFVCQAIISTRSQVLEKMIANVSDFTDSEFEQGKQTACKQILLMRSAMKEHLKQGNSKGRNQGQRMLPPVGNVKLCSDERAGNKLTLHKGNFRGGPEEGHRWTSALEYSPTNNDTKLILQPGTGCQNVMGQELWLNDVRHHLQCQLLMLECLFESPLPPSDSAPC